MARDVSGINVSGDGVAIGTGNTVLVQKNRITNNNRGGKDGRDEHNPLAYGIVALIALIWQGMFLLSLIVLGGIAVGVTAAAVVGLAVPYLLRLLHVLRLFHDDCSIST